MVGEGAGVALVDRTTALSGTFGQLAFKPFRPKIPVRIQLIYPSQRARSQASVQLSEELRRVVAVDSAASMP